MKAVWVTRFGPVDGATVTEAPDPAPGPGQILINVVATDANYPDLLVMEGRYQVKPALPFAPGKAASGTVAALGACVNGFTVGDRVAAQV